MPASGGLGRIVVHRSHFESTTRLQNTPGDAGKLVKGDGELVVVQPPGSSLDPVLEAATLPVSA